MVDAAIVVVEQTHKKLEIWDRTGRKEDYHRVVVDAVKEVADDLGLLPTGGSDYHGDVATYEATHAAVWVPPEVADDLVARMDRPSGAG